MRNVKFQLEDRLVFAKIVFLTWDPTWKTFLMFEERLLFAVHRVYFHPKWPLSLNLWTAYFKFKRSPSFRTWGRPFSIDTFIRNFTPNEFPKGFSTFFLGQCDIKQLPLPKNAEDWLCNKPINNDQVLKNTKCGVICSDGHDIVKGNIWIIF